MAGLSLAATPYNAAFAESMGFVKDFYNIPEYGELLPPAQTALHGYVVEGQGTAREALDDIAAQHTVILTGAGTLAAGPSALHPPKGSGDHPARWAHHEPQPRRRHHR
jgi:threonine dehydratase